MFEVAETHPLDDFLSDPNSYVSRLRETKTPETLTIAGGPGLIVQDAESYGVLMEELEKARFVESLRRAHQNYAEGRSIPLGEVEAMLHDKHGI